MGRREYDGCHPVGLTFPEDCGGLESTHRRHPNIHDDDGKCPSEGLLEGFRPGMSQNNIVAKRIQDSLKRHEILVTVVNNKDGGFAGRTSLGPTGRTRCRVSLSCHQPVILGIESSDRPNLPPDPPSI